MISLEFKIKKEDFPQLEMFLFKLSYPCHCHIKVSFTDSDEVYMYRTVELCNHIVLITI